MGSRLSPVRRPTPRQARRSTGTFQVLAVAENNLFAFHWTTLVLFLATFMSSVLIYSTSTWLPTVMIRSGYDLSSPLEFSIAFTVGAVIGSVSLSVLGDMGHLQAVTVGGFLVGAVGLLTLSTQQPRPVLLLLSVLAGSGRWGHRAS
ncbi:MFS transporter [Streptomyces shenzhenensis]|uniref:Major facilitator superfamily (MFS) profile domain-containing protein n=1 Tax=Streptomyces shenzhenensis TaxID=943815 RepID=A0A3M0I1Q2_9ACTN|nr:hypothetical protein CTZ28_30075 [Streptomyces shenzhenensis]